MDYIENRYDSPDPNSAPGPDGAPRGDTDITEAVKVDYIESGVVGLQQPSRYAPEPVMMPLSKQKRIPVEAAKTSPPGELWKRFFAWLIDGFIIGLAMFPIIIGSLSIFMSLSTIVVDDPGYGNDLSDESALAFGLLMLGMFAAIFILGGLIGGLYSGISISSKWQASPGKKIFGLAVVKQSDSTPLHFGRAFWRHHAYVFAGMLPLYLDYIWVWINPQKRAIHDLIADTLVIEDPRQ